ncbi:hypothetical protein GCM10010324_21870 [Streptomyces hiroshimensis]|uniref:Uncharacterized protein n=1 Tax=Streptomyces hiroshimensis TaxID=66424 RepID=A0ABQ2Y8V8_9ACTN|nr:hypothetical protein GCM10010324_21870 [Streptomyces hiroshimensis]
MPTYEALPRFTADLVRLAPPEQAADLKQCPVLRRKTTTIASSRISVGTRQSGSAPPSPARSWTPSSAMAIAGAS